MPTSSADERPRVAHLAVDGLAAGYKGNAVVEQISIGVPKGEVVSIIGPNGAGKSTLLKAIVGEIALYAGAIRLGDLDMGGLTANRRVRAGMGYVPQILDVFPTLTVAENLEMGGYLLAKSQVEQRTEEVLSRMPALAVMLKRSAGALSGGERKLLAIARALMLSPTLLVLDEPTANLAPQRARAVLDDEVRRLADDGVAILMVEQRARDALGVSDWAYVLVDGKVGLAGRAAELLDRGDLGEVLLGATAQS